MKKITLLSILCLYSIISFAQNGLSISADYGLGRSYERKASPLDKNNYQPNPWSFSSATSRQTDLSISYRANNWIIETGIGYWKSGYTRTTADPSFTNNSSTTGNGTLVVIYPGVGTKITETFIYPQIVIPLSLGYQFGLTKKLSISPYIGAVISNNRNNAFKYKEDTIGYTHPNSTTDFNKGYKRTSWWAFAKLDISYQIKPRWKIQIGPRFDYMLTNLVKNEYWTYEQSPLKLYAFTINAGIAFHLSADHPKQDVINK